MKFINWERKSNLNIWLNIKKKSSDINFKLDTYVHLTTDKNLLTNVVFGDPDCQTFSPYHL